MNHLDMESVELPDPDWEIPDLDWEWLMWWEEATISEEDWFGAFDTDWLDVA